MLAKSLNYCPARRAENRCQELALDPGEVTRGLPEYAQVGFTQSLPPRTPELEATRARRRRLVNVS